MRKPLNTALAVLLAVAAVVLGAFLPQIVCAIDDLIGRGSLRSAEIRAVHLNIREDDEALTIFDKLTLWYCTEHGKIESVPVPDKLCDWTNGEMTENVQMQLQPYFDFGLITQDITILNQQLFAALVSVDGRPELSDVIWTYISEDYEAVSLHVYMDNDTGKILSIQWYDGLNPITDKRRVLDRFGEIYLSALELPEEISVEVMTAPDDQQVMAARYLLTNKNTGEFLRLALCVDDYGFYVNFS